MVQQTGVIKQGAVKTFDHLKILPSGKDILVRSIQMHDDPVTECKSPARVGLAVKGVDADDISRGDVLCSPGSLNLKVANRCYSCRIYKESLLQRGFNRQPDIRYICWNTNQAS